MYCAIGIANPPIPMFGTFIILILYSFPFGALSNDLYVKGYITYKSLIDFYVASICLFLCQIIARKLRRRTPYGAEILGRIRGFKRFIKLGKKEQLEALVEKNPKYFYDILPYAYVLGVSHKWIKDIVWQSPSWYDSTTAFDIHSFGTSMTRTMRNVSTVMHSSPSSGVDSFGSSSGSSGGGSSGGGSGGGGGGAW